ncbi:MAG TPA: hypothetical protein VKB19_10490 [Pedobacter sp.]|nr:hypothetical protein [Pedobacter sp.]
MFKNSKAAIFGSAALSMFCFSAKAQTGSIKPTLFEGVVAIGYIDHGATLNFTGPAIKYTRKPFTLMAGMLPSLKIKDDNAPAGAPRNAVFVPSLGGGITAIYKHIALQMPCLYTAKTASKDGRWNVGVGLGYKF